MDSVYDQSYDYPRGYHDMIYQATGGAVSYLPNEYLSFKWLSRLVFTGLLVLLAMVLLFTGSHFAVCMTAYLNIMIGSLAVLYFVKRSTPETLVPALFLPLMLFSWPLGSIFFAIRFPDFSYGLMHTELPMLYRNFRVQQAVLCFLLGYLPMMFMMARNSRPQSGGLVVNPAKIGGFISLFTIFLFLIHSFSRVVSLPGFVMYIMNGLMKYSSGLLFVPGALFTYLSKKTKIFLLVSLPPILFFYTLGNARGFVTVPLALFFFGLIFFSHLSNKTKIMIIVTGMILLPIYVLIGNTTRTVLGEIGFRDLGARWEALKQWREVSEGKSALAATFGRMFFTGGHSIITQTPETYSYLPFSLFGYVREYLTTLIPGRIYYHPFYTGNWILDRYGFMINEETSVEVSMVGNMWLLGGFFPVFVGGFILSIIHSGFMYLLRRAWRQSAFKAILILAFTGNLLVGAAGLDIIAHWRNLIYRIVFALFVYFFIVALVQERPQQYLRRLFFY